VSTFCSIQYSESEFYIILIDVTTNKNSSVSMAPAPVVDKGSVIKRSTHVAEELTNKKNNVDIEGMSLGCMCNYCMSEFLHINIRHTVYFQIASAVQSDDSDSVDRGRDNSNAVVYDDSSSSSGDEVHVTKRKSTRKV